MENELLENLGRLHTTELGVIRIKKNLSLNVELNSLNFCFALGKYSFFLIATFFAKNSI